MIDMRFRRQAWRLRLSLWFAHRRTNWQSFADRWRVPPVITNRWFVLGAYFLVVLIVGVAWFGRPTLDWQGAKAPVNPPGIGSSIFGDLSNDLAPSPNEPGRSLTAPGDWTESTPGDSDNPAVPVQTPAVEPNVPTSSQPQPITPDERPTPPPPGVQQPSEALAQGGGSFPFDHLSYPVKGDLVNPYADISRSDTMHDWRAHLAVDFSANPGSSVMAAAAGTVKQILQNDILWGTVVIISHDSSYSTSYSSLQDVTVRVGQPVQAGQVIGKLAGSPPVEQLELSHLHFILLNGNDPVDPTEILK